MWFWFGLAVISVICEVLTGTFFFLLFGLGFFCAGIASLFGANIGTQIICFGIVALVSLFVLKKFGVLRMRGRVPVAQDNNINLDVGKIVQANQWTDQGTANVVLRGAQWQARLAPKATQSTSGQYRIVAVEGIVLILEPV